MFGALIDHSQCIASIPQSPLRRTIDIDGSGMDSTLVAVDRLTPEKRSALMRNVKGKHTTPELLVRRMLHRLGFRFRLHKKDLPGKPDIALPGRRKIILVNGCFWHGHDCRYGRLPKSRLEFWVPKIEANQARDARTLEDLENAGWEVLTVWQCETRDPIHLEKRLIEFLTPSKTDARSLSVR